MSTMALALTSAILITAVPEGTEWRFSGKLTPRDAAASRPDKTFSLVVTAVDADTVAFLVDERGAGGWSWLERFGRIDLDEREGAGIRLLYEYDGTPTPLPVRRPVFEFVEQLIPEHQWIEGGAEYTCVRHRTLNNRECAVVEVVLDRGRRQTLVVERNSGVIVSLEERLFMGRGDQFQLTMQLDDQRTVSPEELKAAETISSALVGLRQQLMLGDNSVRQLFLDAQQVAASQAAIAPLQNVAMDGSWGRFVTVVQRDLSVQTRRLEGVSGLEKKFVGQPAPALGDQKRVDGSVLPASDLAGHTTVLHFWGYNGDKLVEPYGQVGYLDFLHNRRNKLGARVVGVAVDVRFADAAQARAAGRTVRKFQEFMNVSFPIVLDDGTLLDKFGDPRTLGSELPLWVVIGHDGVVTHYKVGHFDIQPDEGLRELDAAVVDALKKEKAAARGQ